MGDKGDKKEKGKGKKILFGFGFIAMIAIVIVIIVISIPPSTDWAMDLLNKTSTSSFLMKESEIENYNNFENKVESCKNSSSYVSNYIKTMPTEMADVETLSISLAKVVDFYNDYMPFAEGNDIFNQNYKLMKDGFNGAKENQTNMNVILEEVNKLSELSASYIQSSWVDFRVEYVEFLGNYYQAINALNNIYQGSMGNITTNNLASTTILNTTTDYVKVIYDNYVLLVEDDKELNASSYDYKLQGKIKGFNYFVENYLVNDTDIENYYFNTTIKGKYENLNKFYEVYGEEDMINVISSIEYISNNAVVTKTYETTDSEGIFTNVKLFLTGGVI